MPCTLHAGRVGTLAPAYYLLMEETFLFLSARYYNGCLILITEDKPPGGLSFFIAGLLCSAFICR